MNREIVFNRAAVKPGSLEEQLLRQIADLKEQVRLKNSAINVRDRELHRQSDERNFFRYYYPYTHVTDFLTAGFLLDLRNREFLVSQGSAEDAARAKRRKRKPPKPKVDGDGFFLCTVAYLQDENWTVWDRKVQNRLIRKLVKLGFLQVRKKGCPPRRWLKIMRDKIVEAVDAEILRRKQQRSDHMEANYKD